MRLTKIWSAVTQQFNSPWWVKIDTKVPTCTYYFGPFESRREARQMQSGYVDDLIQENASGITLELQKTRPEMLTVCREPLNR
ncbi:MAG: DUF1816 domain-containing protein [Leptolyngbyaceae bacterium]|nr:DUF1816 domain-containing protein [Leptolyngbyaceae bacterium]